MLFKCKLAREIERKMPGLARHDIRESELLKDKQDCRRFLPADPGMHWKHNHKPCELPKASYFIIK